MPHTPSRPAASLAVTSPFGQADGLASTNDRSHYDGTKRVMDITGAALLLLTSLPLLILMILMLQIMQGRPILIGHHRVGRNGRRFRCLKFRSMVTDADTVLNRHLAQNADAQAEWTATRKLRTDPRVTPLGRVLRKSSVDELPQLLNVLRGEMSLVGPRPIVDAEVVHYGHHIHHYYRVRPGLTGRWQVSGRSDTSYSQRVELDVDYVQNRSLKQDVSILIRTLPAVLASRGSY